MSRDDVIAVIVVATVFGGLIGLGLDAMINGRDQTDRVVGVAFAATGLGVMAALIVGAALWRL